MSMAIVDRALRDGGRRATSTPRCRTRSSSSRHADNVEASGFVEHLKLPHYVDFQAELQLIRRLRREIPCARPR